MRPDLPTAPAFFPAAELLARSVVEHAHMLLGHGLVVPTQFSAGAFVTVEKGSPLKLVEKLDAVGSQSLLNMPLHDSIDTFCEYEASILLEEGLLAKPRKIHRVKDRDLHQCRIYFGQSQFENVEQKPNAKTEKKQ